MILGSVLCLISRPPLIIYGHRNEPQYKPQPTEAHKLSLVACLLYCQP